MCVCFGFVFSINCFDCLCLVLIVIHILICLVCLLIVSSVVGVVVGVFVCICLNSFFVSLLLLCTLFYMFLFWNHLCCGFLFSFSGNSDINQGIHKLSKDIENADWFQLELDWMLRWRDLVKENNAFRLRFKQTYTKGTWWKYIGEICLRKNMEKMLKAHSIGSANNVSNSRTQKRTGHFFLWLMFSKWIWNQNINSEFDKIKCISIITLYLNVNCPSHNLSFRFCLCFYWTLKEDSSFYLVFCWNHDCLLTLAAFSRRLRFAVFFGLN